MSAGNYYGQQPGPGYHDPNAAPQQYQQSGYPPTSGYAAGYQQPPYQQAPLQPPYQDPSQQQYYQQPQAYPGGPPLPHGQQPYQPPPPQAPQGAQPPAATASSWGAVPPSYPAHSNQPITATDLKSDTKGLTDKFNKKLKIRRDSSSSSDDDKKKNKKKNKKKGTFATPPPNMGHGPYPFSFLCPPDNPEMITLQIVDAGSNNPDDTYLIGPNQGTSHPTYIVTLTNDRWKEFNLYRTPLPSMDRNDAEWVSKVGWKHQDTECQVLKFPWDKWEFSLTGEFWGSDVDFLSGSHWFKVLKIEDIDCSTSGRFVARCFDTTHPDMPTVFSCNMRSYSEGKIEIVARLVRTLEQLDEVVTIAWAATSFHREP